MVTERLQSKSLTRRVDGVASTWRQRNKEALRQQLYETALTLFRRDGYEQTTVQDITEAIGVAKATFFNHFPSKEHVVAAWYDGITFACLEEARARRASTATEAIVALCTEMAARAAEAPALLLAKARLGSHPLLVEAEKTQDEEVDAFIVEQIEIGQARGELDTSIDAAFLTGLLGAILTGTSREWVASAGGFDFAGVLRTRLCYVLGERSTSGHG